MHTVVCTSRFRGSATTYLRSTASFFRSFSFHVNYVLPFIKSPLRALRRTWCWNPAEQRKLGIWLSSREQHRNLLILFVIRLLMKVVEDLWRSWLQYGMRTARDSTGMALFIGSSVRSSWKWVTFLVDLTIASLKFYTLNLLYRLLCMRLNPGNCIRFGLFFISSVIIQRAVNGKQQNWHLQHWHWLCFACFTCFAAYRFVWS